MDDATERMAQLRQYAAGRIVAEMPEAVIIGGGAPHILSVSLPGWRSAVLMNFLEARSKKRFCLTKLGLQKGRQKPCA